MPFLLALKSINLSQFCHAALVAASVEILKNRPRNKCGVTISLNFLAYVNVLLTFFCYNVCENYFLITFLKNYRRALYNRLAHLR